MRHVAIVQHACQDIDHVVLSLDLAQIFRPAAKPSARVLPQDLFPHSNPRLTYISLPMAVPFPPSLESVSVLRRMML